MPSKHLILCCPLLLLPSIFPASGSFPMSGLFASSGQSIGVFSFSISPSNEYSGLISFRTDWFDLLTIQGTLKSLLQHHKLKAVILQCSAFVMAQFPHLYMTTGKMSLLFNILSRFVITFLPRSKHLLILWLQSPSTLILEPEKRKSVTDFRICFHFSPCHEGFPGGASGKESACQCRRPKRRGLIPGLGRSLGGGQPTPVFLPGESHGQRSLVGYSL